MTHPRLWRGAVERHSAAQGGATGRSRLAGRAWPLALIKQSRLTGGFAWDSKVQGRVRRAVAPGYWPFPAPDVGQARAAFSRVELGRAGRRRSAHGTHRPGNSKGAAGGTGGRMRPPPAGLPRPLRGGPKMPASTGRPYVAPGWNARMVSRSQHIPDWAKH